jgi:hypothetical protein
MQIKQKKGHRYPNRGKLFIGKDLGPHGAAKELRKNHEKSGKREKL